MKHILYLLIIIFQSCYAMNSQQTQEGAFRQKLQHYLSVPIIETSRDLSEEEKQHFYKIVSPATQSAQQRKAQDVWQKVELHAERHNILDQLQTIVQRTNKFASDTSNILAAEVLNQEINEILKQHWIKDHGINHKSEGSNINLIIAGLKKTQKDMEAGIPPKFEITKQELLCHLLLAYGGAPNATRMIYTALQHYTIVD